MNANISPRPTILVVENEIDLQQMVTSILEELPVDIACADDGEQGLSYLEKHELPILVLLDFHMPNMDGFTFRARQLKDARLRHVPVIFMTSIDRIPSQRDELNGIHCIKKPFDPLELLSAVRQYLK